MKKFLSYSIIATIFIVVFGVMFIFGFFDLKLGQLNLVGSSEITFDPVKVHNEIVEQVHDVAMYTKQTRDLYHSLTPENNFETLKKELEIIEDNKDELEKIVNNQQFADQQYDTLELFNKEYQPTLEEWLNTYLKAVTYFEEKEFTQESIDSFHGVINIAEKEFGTAHNNLVDELNSHHH